jgi:hypothetical protein
MSFKHPRHGTNFDLFSTRSNLVIPDRDRITPTSIPKVSHSEFGTSDHPPPTNRTGLADGCQIPTETTGPIHRNELIDGRFEVISKADGSIASFERFVSNPASKSPKTVGHLYINGLHIRKAMALYAEMCRNPRIRVENFGHSGYSTYALYQNGEGRVFLTEMDVQTLSSFIEITSDGMLASCL